MTEIHYIVHLMKEGKTHKFFIVLKRMPDFGTAYFHAIGVWTDKDPTKEEVELDIANTKDEYIPWHRIDHITNNMYKPR